jgi:hypothetical protein
MGDGCYAYGVKTKSGGTMTPLDVEAMTIGAEDSVARKR